MRASREAFIGRDGEPMASFLMHVDCADGVLPEADSVSWKWETFGVAPRADPRGVLIMHIARDRVGGWSAFDGRTLPSGGERGGRGWR